MQHATDTALIARNGAERGEDSIEIIGSDCDFSEVEKIRITAKHHLEIWAATLVRKKLGLSNKEFKRMCEEGKIVCLSGQNLKKCKMNGEITIQVNP